MGSKHVLHDLPTAESYGFNVRRSHRAFDRLLNVFLTRHGLKTGYWYYLRVLWIRDGLTQKQMSDLNNVTENTTAALIGGMIKDKLVTRRRDPGDKRKWIVSLTARGVALRQELLPYAARVNLIASEGIPERELATFLSVLKRMSKNLERDLE